MLIMEQFIAEIETYAAACGLQPTTVIQRAIGASGATWGKWKAGASCSMASADRVRTYIAENPPACRPPAANTQEDAA